MKHFAMGGLLGAAQWIVAALIVVAMALAGARTSINDVFTAFSLLSAAGLLASFVAAVAALIRDVIRNRRKAFRGDLPCRQILEVTD